MMEYLRSSVSLRAYGHRDPLVEYKTEGLKMFRDMEIAISNEIIRMLQTISGEVATKSNPVDVVNLRADNTLQGGVSGNISVDGRPVVSTHGEKTGRNDLCPCGSGKKYKKCHGK